MYAHFTDYSNTCILISCGELLKIIHGNQAVHFSGRSCYWHGRMCYDSIVQKWHKVLPEEGDLEMWCEGQEHASSIRMNSGGNLPFRMSEVGQALGMRVQMSTEEI